MAMTYGQPSIPSVIDELLAQSIEHLIVLPLYPQSSATTTAAVFDRVAKHLLWCRDIPSLYFIRDYYQQPGYLAALKASLLAHQQQHGIPDHIIISFHAIPQVYVNKGDPYLTQCEETARLLANALELSVGQWQMAFQSRFGRQAWLHPYLDQVMKKLPEQGVRHVQIICPGFAADCFETLEEVAQYNKAIFLAAGGERFEYIPALNDQVAHIRFLASLLTCAIKNFL
jgi:ferrochelatase